MNITFVNSRCSRLTKISEPCYIYPHYIKNKDDQYIFLDSIIYDNNWMYYRSLLKKQFNHIINSNDMSEIMKRENKLYKNLITHTFLHEVKTLHPEWDKIGRKKNNFEINNISKIKQINKTVFYFNYDELCFAHKTCNGYRYFMQFFNLRKKIPNISLILPYNLIKPYEFIIKLLNIKNIILINKNEKVMNKGITFCYALYSKTEGNDVEHTTLDFYHNIIAKKSLEHYKVNINNKLYPKKLLFLKRIESSRGRAKILNNRKEVVELCQKYGYVDIDQTTYKIPEVIFLMNNATHCIMESGGSMIHFLWTKNIKSIILSHANRPIHIPQPTPNYVNKDIHKFIFGYFDKVIDYKKSYVILNNDKRIHDFLIGEKVSLGRDVKSSWNSFNELEEAIKQQI